MQMYLNDYDPDDPPVSTHDMEADRLLGVMIHRAVTMLIVAWLIGVDPVGFTLPALFGERPWAALLLGLFFLRVLVPAAQSLEHLYRAIRG